MAEKATKITRVEIKGLWDRYDLVWDLLPDVNILAGVNGSGKSTILRMIYEEIFTARTHILHPNHLDKAEKIQIDFNEGLAIIRNYPKGGSIGGSASEYNAFEIEFVSTFDQDLERVSMDLGPDMGTTLDLEIRELQHTYLDYQLNLGKRVFEILRGRSESRELVALQVSEAKDRFLDIMDDLFGETGKSIDRESNEISFKSGSQQIHPSQLSAGEKQLLIILMTVLVQDNRPSILLMDEPEISLHIDWQKKLIGYIRELNPNCQVILATHSPAIIMEGWADHVFEVRDLITNAVPQ